MPSMVFRLPASRLVPATVIVRALELWPGFIAIKLATSVSPTVAVTIPPAAAVISWFTCVTVDTVPAASWAAVSPSVITTKL